MYYIQLIERTKTEAQAQEMLEGLRLQIDLKAGRVYYSSKDSCWQLQAFFTDSDAGWLPDGLRRVFVPQGQRRALGFSI